MSELGRVYAKAEFIQPGGSVKDRVALHIIEDAYEFGNLQQQVAFFLVNYSIEGYSCGA